jgi:tetratricopeptide (TPR) repeat protein
VGLSYLGERDPIAARGEFEKVNDWSGLGLCELKLGNYEKAREWFEKDNDHSGLGLLAMHRGDYDRAIEHFTIANDKIGLGQVYLQRREFERARKYFQEANDYDGLGDLHYILRNFETAHECFKKVGNRVKALQCLRESRDYEAAVDYAAEAIREGEVTGAIKLELSEVHRALKNYPEARALLHELESDPEFADAALYHHARLSYDMGNYNEAIDYYKELLHRHPQTRFRAEAMNSIKTVAEVRDLLEGGAK